MKREKPARAVLSDRVPRDMRGGAEAVVHPESARAATRARTAFGPRSCMGCLRRAAPPEHVAQRKRLHEGVARLRRLSLRLLERLSHSYHVYLFGNASRAPYVLVASCVMSCACRLASVRLDLHATYIRVRLLQFHSLTMPRMEQCNVCFYRTFSMYS